MISGALQKWTIVIFGYFGTVLSQMPMPMQMQMAMPYPMPGYGPMMMPAPPPPPPMAMPIPVPVPIPIPYEMPTTTTSTTTTEKPATEGVNSDGNNRIPIAIPIPVPHFVQIAIPSFQPDACFKKNGKSCPPCPPCSCNPCTPSFFSFCSPCHLKCRCRNPNDAPIPQEPRPPIPFLGPAFPMPMPMPMPAPPPVVIVPFPPLLESEQPPSSYDSDCESTDDDLTSSDSCDSDENRKKRRRPRKKKPKKPKYDIYRRNLKFINIDRSDNELVKPVLTYMSRNGDIKMKRRLSNDEASALIDETESLQNVQLVAGNDGNDRHRVVVMSKPLPKSRRSRHRQILLQRGTEQHVLKKGKKELVFSPPDNRRISNLSVSFQIAR